MSETGLAPEVDGDAAGAPDPASAGVPGPVVAWDRRRLIAAAVLVVAIFALAVMALASGRSLRSVTEVRPVGDAIGLVTKPIAPVAQVSAPLAPSSGPASITPPRTRTITRTVEVAAPPTASAPDPTPAPPSAPGTVYQDCPALGLPAPERTGGLQSLIAIVPLFGPFSPEAFAFMPAFEGGFYFFGPMLPEAERALNELSPLLEAVTPGAQQLGQAGYDALIPFYEPYRQQFLDAEGDLAAQLAPVVEGLVTAPGAECAIALEGVLAEILADRPDLAA